MVGQVDSLLKGLLRAKGLSVSMAEAPQLRFELALALGDVSVLDQLWHELGFDTLVVVFRRASYTTPVEHAVCVMVFNRLFDPHSKLGVLRWLETVSIPNIQTDCISHPHLLPSMGALMDHQEAIDSLVAGLLKPLVDQDLSLVFYDLTTIRAAGLSEQVDDLLQYGMAKEGLIARQFMLGVVQTTEGLPNYHEGFDGNQAEAPTLIHTVQKVLARYPHIKRMILVADSVLLSLDNLDELEAIKLPGGLSLEFILAVPGRRYGEFVETLQTLQSDAIKASTEIVQESKVRGHRLVVAHHPKRAKEQSQLRQSKIAQLEEQAGQWVGKLNGQDEGKASKSRKLSDSGAKARQYHAVKEARLAHILRVDLKSELYSYTIDEAALAQAQLIDGTLMLVTNVADLSPTQIVERYKALADIERCFWILESELEIVPVYHHLARRIRSHAMIYFMALIVYRVMRSRLHQSSYSLSPERALEQLKKSNDIK